MRNPFYSKSCLWQMSGFFPTSQLPRCARWNLSAVEQKKEKRNYMKEFTFKGFQVVLQGLSVLALQFIVVCFVVFQMISQCLLPTVETLSQTASILESACSTLVYYMWQSCLDRICLGVPKIYTIPVKSSNFWPHFRQQDKPLYMRGRLPAPLMDASLSPWLCCRNQDWHRHKDHNPHWLETWDQRLLLLSLPPPVSAPLMLLLSPPLPFCFFSSFFVALLCAHMWTSLCVHVFSSELHHLMLPYHAVMFPFISYTCFISFCMLTQRLSYF